jgi:cation:H+ antiporter
MIPLRAALDIPWQRRIAVAGACAFVGVLFATAGARAPAWISAGAIAVGILGASLLLAWAADAAEVDVSGRLVIMVVALVASLPELTVEVHLAFTRQVQFVTANFTGATRLLLTAAIALPAFGAVLVRARGQTMPHLVLSPARRLDLVLLAVAAVVALPIVLSGELTPIEGIILGGLYLVYALQGRGAEDGHRAAAGVAAGIASLDAPSRRRLSGALFLFAAVAVFLTARAFPDELMRAGQASGIDPYLLIQWVIPLFTESPELVVAGALVLNRRPAQGVALLLASSLINLTLGLASVSFAYLVGGGGSALPLSGRERIELLLTSATTLMAVAALASLELERIDSWIVAAGFGVQTVFPNPPVRLLVAVALLVFAVDALVGAVRPSASAGRAGRRVTRRDRRATSEAVLPRVPDRRARRRGRDPDPQPARPAGAYATGSRPNRGRPNEGHEVFWSAARSVRAP